MKLLIRFWSDFVKAYRWWYALGVIFLIATNLLTVSIPKFLEHAIVALKLGSSDAADEFAEGVTVRFAQHAAAVLGRLRANVSSI